MVIGLPEVIELEINKHFTKLGKDATKNIQAIVELSREYDVYFVTADKGFYENRESKRGLVKQLKQEVESLGTTVDIYESTDLFLNAIKQEVPGIDKDKLMEHLKYYLFDQLKSTDKTFEDMVFKEVKSSKVSLFLTERTKIISVSFEVEIIADFFVSNNNVYKGTVKVEGECSYDLEALTISNLSLDSIEKYNGDGSKNVSRIIRATAAIFGKRVIHYRFKSPLN